MNSNSHRCDHDDIDVNVVHVRAWRHVDDLFRLSAAVHHDRAAWYANARHKHKKNRTQKRGGEEEGDVGICVRRTEFNASILCLFREHK